MESRKKTTHAHDFLSEAHAKRKQEQLKQLRKMEQDKWEADTGCFAKFFGKKAARFVYGVDEDQIHMLRAQLVEKKPEPSFTEKAKKASKKASKKAISYFRSPSNEKEKREEARVKYGLTKKS